VIRAEQVTSARPSRLKAALKVIRLHQWSKNALVVVPVLLAPHGLSSMQVVHAALAALALSLCASAGYVFNDLMDVAADRAHPTKNRRPFASGALPTAYGPPLILGLLAVSVAISLYALPMSFFAMLVLYFAITLAYSFYLKSLLLVDVIVLAWLYTQRVLAGGFATGVSVSAWLLAFSMFIFLSLAFAKRHIELRHALDENGKLRSRGYYAQDLTMVISMGTAAVYLAVLVFCLYIESSAGNVIYSQPRLLWLICPVLLYWISRVWFLTHRGAMNDDPVKFALTDRRSWLCALAVGAVAVAARFWPI
jgi:4-hydroxybenzoate polyprenyltransferase